MTWYEVILFVFLQLATMQLCVIIGKEFGSFEKFLLALMEIIKKEAK